MIARNAVRRFLKLIHTLGAAGLMGSIASLIVLSALASPASSLVEYALLRGAMGAIATWIFFPSLGATLVAGLLAIACSKSYLNASWAWASGILIFEAGFVGVLGPMQDEAKRSAKALAGLADASTLAASIGAERNTLCILLAIATINVVLGIWRPKLGWRNR